MGCEANDLQEWLLIRNGRRLLKNELRNIVSGCQSKKENGTTVEKKKINKEKAPQDPLKFLSTLNFLIFLKRI